MATTVSNVPLPKSAKLSAPPAAQQDHSQVGHRYRASRHVEAPVVGTSLHEIASDRSVSDADLEHVSPCAKRRFKLSPEKWVQTEVLVVKLSEQRGARLGHSTLSGLVGSA